MGAWGTGLFSDDVACDVRAQFRTLLEEGMSVPAATRRILQDWGEALEDAEDGPVIWLALASLQWDQGALQQRVKSRAIRVIDSGADLAKWATSATPRKLSQRKTVLRRLKQKLESPPPQRKMSKAARRTTKKKQKDGTPATITWNLGEIVAYRLRSRDWILLHVISLSRSRQKEDAFPTFAVLKWRGQDLPSEDAISRLPYRKPPRTTRAWGDAIAPITERRAYCIDVAHRTQKSIPRSRLQFTGFTKPPPFQIEKPDSWFPGVLWRLLDGQLQLDLGLE